jgi:2-methylcitrate dehydratase PrpD
VSSPVTDAVSAFVSGGATATFDDTIRELARRHVLDTVASIVACRDLGAARVARRYARANSGSRSGVSILGTTERASLVDAVFASAMAGHAAEVNDFMPAVFVQPGPAIVSTALCLAEQRHLSGDAVLRAVVVGYELAARVPRALGGANLRRAHLASHGVGPVFGSAAAAASLLAIPGERIGDVLACCTQQASGSWQWLLDEQHIEKAFVFAGMGARNGVQAALLVEAGFRGVPRALDHPEGWYATITGNGDRDERALTQGFDAPDALHGAAVKSHPVGGPVQPAVEALLGLVAEVDAGEVARVVIRMPGRAAAFRDAAMPALNLRYLAAIILLDGRLDFLAAQSIERMHHDPEVATLMGTVEVVHDPAQESGHGRDRTESALVTLTLSSGAVREMFVASVRGFPTDPMDGDEVAAKARELLAPHLPAGRVEAVVDACRRLDDLDDARRLVRLIAG